MCPCRRADHNRPVPFSFPEIRLNQLSTVLAVTPYIPHQTLLSALKEEEQGLVGRESTRGAVLFIDLAGFTPLSVNMGEVGALGLEKLQEIMMDYFTRLISRIHAFGGVVYQFAGDSILVSFPAQDDENDALCARRVAACALLIQRELSQRGAVEAFGREYRLSARVGLGYGDYSRVLLGSPEYWLVPAILGLPVGEAVNGENQARGGEIVVSEEYWELLGDDKRGESLGINWRLDGLEAESPPEDHYAFDFGGFDPDRTLAVSARLLNPLLFKKFSTGHAGFIGVYREISCVFVRFECTKRNPADPLYFEQINEYYRFMQQECQKYGGALIQTDLSDKGNLILILFGAPMAAEEKEILAARLSLALVEGAREFPFIDFVKTGVTTGFAYCGDLGAPFRKGYTVLGEVANLAARLATYSDESAVYIDAATARRLRAQFELKKLGLFRLKGISDPVGVLEVRAEARRVPGFLDRYSETLGLRSVELREMLAEYREVSAGSGRICVVTGEAGMGKSKLAESFLSEIEGDGPAGPGAGPRTGSSVAPADVYYACSYFYERNTPFFPWQELLNLFFRIFDADSPEERLEKIREQFREIEEDLEWVPLIAEILGLPVASGGERLSPRQKHNRIFPILFHLIEHRSRTRPVVLYFEDAHLADELSWELIEFIGARVAGLPVMLLLLMRPDREIPDGLREGDHLRFIMLGQLDEPTARSFLRNKLNLSRPEPPLENLILEAARGNPLYLDSIVESLVEQGHLETLQNGQRHLTTPVETIHIPASLQDVILSRIDQLAENEQVILKTAAVIGATFNQETLDALLSERFGDYEIAPALGHMENLGFLEGEDASGLYSFKNLVIQDTAYNTLLLSTRTDLHRRLARYLEENLPGYLNEMPDVLAYHYIAAGDYARGLDFSLMAAWKSKARFANKDAIQHLEKALSILNRPDFTHLGATLEKTREELAGLHRKAGNYDAAIRLFQECLEGDRLPLERAELYIGLGHAYQEKGVPEQAQSELETALRILGHSPPGGRLSTLLRVGREFAAHRLYKNFPGAVREVSMEDLPRLEKQASVLMILAKIYLWQDSLRLLWAVLARSNIARRLDTPAELSSAAYDLALLNLGRGNFQNSRRYVDLCARYAEESEDAFARARSLQLKGTLQQYENDPSRAIDYYTRAIAELTRIEDQWDLLTSMGALAFAYRLASDFEAAVRVYTDLGQVALDLNSLMHLGWAYSTGSFCKYLLGQEDVDALRYEIRLGLKTSRRVQDSMNQLAGLGHLAAIAVRERSRSEAEAYAREIFDLAERYPVSLPPTLLALVDACEAAIFVEEQDPGGGGHLRGRIRGGLRTLAQNAKAFRYLNGPLLRLRARWTAFEAGPSRAAPLFREAIKCLEPTGNHWERGVAFLDAAVCLPDARAEYLARAERIFREYELGPELKRVERLRGN